MTTPRGVVLEDATLQRLQLVPSQRVPAGSRPGARLRTTPTWSPILGSRLTDNGLEHAPDDAPVADPQVRRAIEELRQQVGEETAGGGSPAAPDGGAPRSGGARKRRTLLILGAVVAVAVIAAAIAVATSSSPAHHPSATAPSATAPSATSIPSNTPAPTTPATTTPAPPTTAPAARPSEIATYLSHAPPGATVGVAPGAVLSFPPGLHHTAVTSASAILAAHLRWLLTADPPGSGTASAYAVTYGHLVAIDTGTARLYSLPAVSPSVPTSAPPGTVQVAPGDSFWSIAQQLAASRLGHAPTNAQIAGVWQPLVTANLGHLVHPGDPNLIYPGQVLTVPSP